MITTNRKFLIGAAGLLAAPAIVRHSSPMPIKTFPGPTSDEIFGGVSITLGDWSNAAYFLARAIDSEIIKLLMSC